MVTFQNKFFSAAGQKERLANVGATFKAAVTGQGVRADTGNKTADKVLSAAASHPFITAGVAAAAVSIATFAPAISKIGTAAPALAKSSSLRGLAIAGGAGLAAGALAFGGGKATTGDQTTTPTQTPTQNVYPQQDSHDTTNIDNSIRTYNSIRGSPNARIGQDIYQNNPYTPTQTQSTPSYQTATQDTTPSQSASESGGGASWLLIAAVIGGAYLLSKR